ncbi:probable serine/threonine-protein kinase At1g01540 isoform X2 [Henckelia pumila]|uniref:probable serine/threonine-protein kinase At1g01540 isoform X2 n=1 Tax=Henckelia pumila TaxID=405737 RepID=UPI003C6E4710
MAGSFAVIVGAVGGALAVLATVILLLWICMKKHGKFSNKNSETGSSDPSAVVEMKRGGSSPFSVPSITEIRQFRMEELEQATRNFSETNLIGCGTFGLVFKGLLSDGTVVAIKRRIGEPRQEFVEEVAYLSTICHRNLVVLLGYCQERGYQMLVSEYLPNGSMCSHLYDTGKGSTTKLEFKQRLQVAIGAAKGLCHLHGLNPPFVHGNFKTGSVLVDENFIAKVADAGMSKILEKIEDGASSGSSSFNAFKDPEMEHFEVLYETSDVYSFGVFLLELITGKEATTYKEAYGSNHSLIQLVEDHLRSNDLVDPRLVGSFTAEGMRDLLWLMLKCMNFPGKDRPRMENLVVEIDRILETEIERTIVMGEGTATVTLGSQLFTS